MTTPLHLPNTTLAVDINIPQWAVALLVVGFLFLSIVMILIVLIQRPQGGGLSGAFGGGGSSGSAGQTAFGARTGDALTITTITIFILYLLAAVFLNYTIAPPTAENPAIVAAAESSADGETDDSTTFVELPPVVLDGEGDGTNTIKLEAPGGQPAGADEVDHTGHNHPPVDHSGHDHDVNDDTSGG